MQKKLKAGLDFSKAQIPAAVPDAIFKKLLNNPRKYLQSSSRFSIKILSH